MAPQNLRFFEVGREEGQELGGWSFFPSMLKLLADCLMTKSAHTKSYIVSGSGEQLKGLGPDHADIESGVVLSYFRLR